MSLSEEPCNTCGAPVRLVESEKGASMATPTAKSLDRICTDTECRTNTSARGMEDHV